MSKSPSLRRIQADVRELALDPSDRYHAAPLENDMFEWHFTIRGAEGTDFEGGIYHGRILLPAEYPFKPPHIVFLTPSGRFETNTKVCLSFSAFHPELWQPAWGIRLILEALISFLPTPADGAIGALDWSSEERKRLAKLSQSFSCRTCGKCCDLLPELKEEEDGCDESTKKKKRSSTNRFAKEIAELQRLQQQADKKKKPESENKIGTDKKAAAGDSQESKEEGKPSVETACTSTESIDQAAPEEEIVFGAASPTSGSAAVAVTVTEKEANAEAESSGDADPVPNMDHAEVHQQQVQQEAIVENDPSWMYDPLLNLMMVLLAVICYLLVQKFLQLMDELYELQQLTYMSRS